MSGARTSLVRGRRLSAKALADRLPALRELRELGATVVRIGATGELLVAFDQPAKPFLVESAKPTDEDADLEFASADD